MEEGDSRIKHELRDVEFVTRLADEVDTFLSLVDMNDDDTAKIPAQHWADFIKVFTAAKQIPSPKPEDQYGSWRKYPGWYASHWFNYLKQNDRPRWQEATSKLVDELGRRGVMRKIQRTKNWVPVVEPRHDAWGQSVATFARDNKGKPWAQTKRDYERLIDSLNTEQLVRHKQLVEETGDREYWVTPRWQGWDGESELPWHGGNVPDHPKLPKKYR